MQKNLTLAYSFLWFVICLNLTGCGGKSKHAQDSAPAISESDDTALLLLEGANDGLTIVLSEGTQSAGTNSANTIAQSGPLPDATAQQLLSRMPSLLGKQSDKQAFALRQGSTPPPRTGKTVPHAFPPSTTQTAPNAKSSGPLKVTRYAPEGKVPLAPHLSVSFSQPMIPLTSHADSIKNIPVTLTPQPPGQWRWIGTKTLLFDPEVRFPMATKFRVATAARVISANGDVLDAPVQFDFETPALTLRGQYPSGRAPQELKPLIYIGFDQRINPEALLKSIQLQVNGTPTGPVRQATESEIESDKRVFGLVQSAKKLNNGLRWIVVRPQEPLPKDSRIVVSVEPGAPSAEGPLLTTSSQSFWFHTYGPLRITKHRCGWSQCPPGSQFTIEFSNPLDEADFDAQSVRVSPELTSSRIEAQGQRLTVRGQTLGRTNYVVTVPATVTDTFGQTLGAEETRNFQVGEASPRLFSASGLTISDPSSTVPSFDVHSVNIKSLNVQIYRVDVDDWEAFGQFMQGNPRRPKPVPGQKVFDDTVSVAGKIDGTTNTAIDLRPALNKAGKGHAVVIVEPTTWHNQYKPRIKTWVQVTDIGLDAFADADELIVWATKLKDGSPLNGVALSIRHTQNRALSDTNGMTTFPLHSGPAKQGQRQTVVAKEGNDIAFLPHNVSFWSNTSSFRGSTISDNLRWFTFDDRGMYKPGESVHIKGWVRKVQNGEGGDITNSAVKNIDYTVIGPRGNKLFAGKSKVNALGAYDFHFRLPKTPNLGRAYIQLAPQNGGAKSSHSFQIQEFRRPEFEVSATASQGPHIVGAGADIAVSAKYYAGGPLASADTTWRVSTSATSFTPPNQSEYTFGSWVPWWGWGRSAGYPQSRSTPSQNFSAKTDASGKQVLHMDFVSVKPPRPMSVVANANVMDVNRQSWASSATLLVHPSNLYIGLARDRYYVEQGTPIKVTGVIVDQEGNTIAGRSGSVKAARIDWKYKNGKYEEVEATPQTCAVVAQSGKPFLCKFATPVGGRYKIVATVIDDKGRPNQTEITTWVSGGTTPPQRNVSQEVVTLIPDKKEYADGDTAQILVQSPFFPCDGILSIRRSGIVSTRSFHMDSATQTLKVPIAESMVPNLYVQVDLVGSAQRVDDKGQPQPALPRRPAYAKGTLNLAVPPVQRTLKVTAVPQEKRIAPGTKTSLAVTVVNAAGTPVANADVAVVVVDEAVLALSGISTPDPIASFYAQRPSGGTDYHQRQWIRLAEPDLSALGQANENHPGSGTMEMETMSVKSRVAASPAPPPSAPRPTRARRGNSNKQSSPGGGSAIPTNNTPIAVRQNFDALAAFSPSVVTDSRGKTRVSFTVPDNLTRYRIMVVAAAGKNQFGRGDSNVTARMPLMVRPSPPRFLNFGDKFELPVVLQNQTDTAMQVQVAVRATNASIDGGAGRIVEVPANDRVEVRFPSSAQMAGTARFQVAASSGPLQDANEFSLPVWTPATTEAFASYGEIDSGSLTQPVHMPANVVKQFGGLQVSISSTQLQALTDAILYLVQYPYECSEQTASRIMGVAALRDVLDAFNAPGMPSKQTIEATVQRDIERLATLQNANGGFAFWVKSHDSWPYNSIFAAHALTVAKAKGFAVPERLLHRSKRYLQEIEQHIPGYYGIKVRRMLIAYALYVRKDMGDTDVPRAKALLNTAGAKELSIETLGRLIHVFHGERSAKIQLSTIHRHIANKVNETAAAANWVDGYADGGHLVLYSSRRADGVMLEALIEDNPQSDLIPKVVRGLLAHRVRGKWSNTQENVFVLLAMDKYFQAFEKTVPNFVAQLWYGNTFAGAQSFRGRSNARHNTDIPMQYLADQKGDQNLILNKRGRGRLYYRVGMTYAPTDLQIPAADHGFAIERSYEGVDDPSDVVRQKNGDWAIKAGTRVRVRLTMVAQNRRYHVALVDPLPAGLEAINPALAVTGALPQESPSSSGKRGRFWWWSRTWYEHQNMRDERVEAFTSVLWAGVHKYDYVARATTPGRFVVPPTKAEEMYFPETFGRSASDVVIVK